MSISIKILKHNPDLHKDLELNLSGMEDAIRADCYFFFSNLELSDKTRFNERYADFLFKHLGLIANLKVNGYNYIPFDLSDQYSGWIGVKKINNKGLLNLFYIDSLIKGSTINPWEKTIDMVTWEKIISIREACLCYFDDFEASIDYSINNYTINIE